MEPFNLREERGEGYFDQFLNYHKTKSKETDPWWQLLDEDKEKDEALFNKKYQLSDDIVQKHKEEYDKFENANTEINLLNEWKSLLPLFENNTQTITEAMQSLSKVIRKNDKHSNVNKRPTKKRKLNQNNTNNLYKIEDNDNMDTKKSNGNKDNGKRKKRKRAWEINSDDENKNENEDNDKISARELMGYKRKFELFSEKATMLIANGDHNIYQQTRDSLIQRIKLVEDENLFKRQQKEAIELKRRIEQQKKRKQMEQQLQNKPKSEKEKLDDMLADFDDEDDDEEDDVDMIQDNDDNASKSKQNQSMKWNETDLIWSYYWKHDEKEIIHGPFSCKQMVDWNDLYFKAQPIMFRNKKDNKWFSSDKINLIEKLKTYSSSNN